MDARAKFEGLPAGFVLSKTAGGRTAAETHARGLKAAEPGSVVRVLKSGGKWRVFVKRPGAQNPARRKNFLGFGKKKTAATARKRSSLPISQLSAAAYKAGLSSGEPRDAGVWVDDRAGDRAPAIVSRLEREFERGARKKQDDGRAAAVAKAKRAAEVAARLASKDRELKLRRDELEAGKQKRRTALASYRGVKLWKLGTGQVVSSIDSDSHFDGLRDAKEFIDSHLGTRNPKLGSRSYTSKPAADAALKRIAHEKRHGAYVGYDTSKKRWAIMFPKRNPESEAAALSAKFHGRPATQLRTILITSRRHGVLTELGELVQVVVETPTGVIAEMDFALSPANKVVYLASSEDGRQLFFEGGDQQPNLKALGMGGAEWLRDHMELGRLVKFTYRTRKGMHDFKLVDYWHVPGEESGLRPVVTYDPRNKSLGLVGGRYHVDAAGVID